MDTDTTTEASDVAGAKNYALHLIYQSPRASLTEAVIAAMCAFDSMHVKSNAHRVGCARAVQAWVDGEPAPSGEIETP